jgi:6-phosphogluconolactonase (cycloisomerase 2 family)
MAVAGSIQVAGIPAAVIGKFRVDAQSGRLSPAGQSLEIGAPVCLVFVPN